MAIIKKQYEKNLVELVNQEKTLLKFRLKDVYFHNDTKVTIEDIQFTIERGKQNKHPQFEEIKTITKINKTEFEIELKQETPYWHFTFCNFIRILNEKAAKENPNEGLKIGAGPYKLVNYVKGDKIEMELFEKYHNKTTIPGSPRAKSF
ncbi:MAG: ABC transporter substrate-binding protein [Candidatus Phytoplasma sp. TWB_XP]